MYEPTPQTIKLVVVGDLMVGKTCLFITYTTNTFPEEYIPTLFGSYSCFAKHGQKTFPLALWDTMCVPDDTDDFSRGRLRPLAYPGTSIFLLLFSVADPASFDHIKTKWHPEVSHYCPHAPIILVGNKIDLREDPLVIQILREKQQQPISLELGTEMAQSIKAISYMECSCLTLTGVNDLFEAAVKAAIEAPTPTNSKRCTLF